MAIYLLKCFIFYDERTEICKITMCTAVIVIDFLDFYPFGWRSPVLGDR
jgi:hypothetical protein